MAMYGNRDKPTWYNLVTEDGKVVACVAKSRVLIHKKALEFELGVKLKMILTEDNSRAVKS